MDTNAKLYWPEEMRIAPRLDPAFQPRSRHPRRALLISPFYAKDPRTSFGKHALTPALTLTSVAAATPPGWEVLCWDENLLQGPPPVDPFPRVVGITVHLTFAGRAYELARFYRSRGAVVVLGGLHVLSCPEEAAAHADSIAIGDGVQLWPRILKDVQDGELRSMYQSSFGSASLDSQPVPSRNVVPSDSFLTIASIIATRGCRNRCNFCYLSTRGLQVPPDCREPGRVAAELRQLKTAYAVFLDNNLGASADYLRRLCRALRPLGMIWSAAVTLDVADDPALVRDMALSGCTGVFVGFESLSDDSIRNAGKRAPRVADYARGVRIFHEFGIQVNGSFVLGFDQDGPDTFARTIGWIEENRLECATFHILTPYPGTPLFDKLKAEGRLLHTDWNLYDTGHVVFRPARLTAEELEEGYAWCYRTLFSHRSIWLRRPRKLSSLPSYLAGSYLYKRCNRLWPLLIRHRWTAALWRPMIELSRWKHLRFRRKLEAPQPAARRTSVMQRIMAVDAEGARRVEDRHSTPVLPGLRRLPDRPKTAQQRRTADG